MQAVITGILSGSAGKTGCDSHSISVREFFLSEELTKRLVASALGNSSFGQDPMDRLRDRERNFLFDW